MPSGEKRVQITSGGQSKSNNEITGVFIKKITFNRSATPVKQNGKWVVVYGDSISVGGNVSNPSAEAWPVLLRKHYPVTVAAYGYNMLYDDAATSAERSELASSFASWAPGYIWLAIGTNDYGFEKWSAREFGEAYAATLDVIHSSNSRARVFAQSPIHRGDERPNSFGDDLEKYRQQIAAACLSRPDWCVFVDGTDPAFPQPDELDKDGIHLTTKSSIKYAEAVLDIISK
jgi:lysophospholipase L1-like esterase